MIEIQLNEKFDHLSRAPIVEALMDIRARVPSSFDESSARSFLESLEGYAFLDSQRELRFDSHIKDGKAQGPIVTDLGWEGVKFQSKDKTRIAQITKNGIVFSRLAPYTNWQQFSSEGLLLWETFKEKAVPDGIHRIGLRFVNRIQLSDNEIKVHEYLNPAPDHPQNLDLPFFGFMHHDLLGVPGHPYAINVIRTIQPAGQGSGAGVILDIDVFTLDGAKLDESKLSRHLDEMRWLKNKVFFGSITEKTKALCL